MDLSSLCPLFALFLPLLLSHILPRPSCQPNPATVGIVYWASSVTPQSSPAPSLLAQMCLTTCLEQCWTGARALHWPSNLVGLCPKYICLRSHAPLRDSLSLSLFHPQFKMHLLFFLLFDSVALSTLCLRTLPLLPPGCSPLFAGFSFLSFAFFLQFLYFKMCGHFGSF